MKTSESQFLFKEKLNEDKGEIEAMREIKSLQDHERAFKILWREKESLKKEVEKLEKKLKEVDGFKAKFKEMKSEHTEKIYAGSIKHLRRIIHFMEKDKRYSIKELMLDLCMCNEDLRGCLDFLKEFNLINVEYPKEGGIIRK